MDPSELDASVTSRVPTCTNRDDRYFTDTFQAMPLQGYTRMFEAMLESSEHQVDAEHRLPRNRQSDPWKHMIYTGPIDAFFDFKFGKLPYRSLQFEHVTLPVERFQPVGTVNYPNDYAYTRISEFKHITGQTIRTLRSCTSIRAPTAIPTIRYRRAKTQRCTSGTRPKQMRRRCNFCRSARDV